MLYIDTPISTLRKDLTECLKRVDEDDVSFVIKRRQKPYAVLSRFHDSPSTVENCIECSLSQIRPEICDLINRVFYNNLNIIIKRHHHNIAIIKPFKEAHFPVKEGSV